MIKKYWWNILAFLVGGFAGGLGSFPGILFLVLGMLLMTIGYESGYLVPSKVFDTEDSE